MNMEIINRYLTSSLASDVQQQRMMGSVVLLLVLLVVWLIGVLVVHYLLKCIMGYIKCTK